MGGLECASILSRQGKSVLVLERQIQPGGCMQSYRRGSLSLDTGLHYVGGLGEGQTLHAVFRYLGLLDLPWQRLDADGFDRVTIGGETLPFCEGYDNFARVMADRFPSERAALQDYVALLRRSDEEQLATLLNPTEASRQFSEMLFSTNAYAFLRERFTDDLLINYLAGTSLKMELHKPTLPLFTFLHGNGSFIQSSWRLRGDGNMLVRRLVDNITSCGGQVLCGSEVTSLRGDNGRVRQAVCADGEVYEADTFISAVHPAVTCTLLKDSGLLKNLYVRRMQSLANTFGMFTATLCLKPGAVSYFNHNKFVYEAPNVWELSQSRSGGDGVLVSCPYSATGSATHIDLLSPMLWSECRQWEDTTVGRRGGDYKAFKLRRAEELIAQAGRQIPGLADAVESVHCSTPLTYRDYNLTPEGCAYGIRKDCTAPLMTILTPRTPVSNLLMTGQSLMLHGLHGVTMTSLFTCAEVLGNMRFMLK